MEQTAAHEYHNPDLLRLIPTTAATVVEVGCSSGALAREYKKLNHRCRYVGVEVVPEYAALARRYCDEVLELDIEAADERLIAESLPGDCWVFGDSLEHLRDPWALLKKLRRVIPDHGCVVACIPNAQHWSVQARLNSGQLFYEDSGLLDRSHLRWFTRITILQLLQDPGFVIEAGLRRILSDARQDEVVAGIRRMAEAIGMDPEIAVQDALVFQYVLRAVPGPRRSASDR
jgi:SAM-dependent methyltransferase